MKILSLLIASCFLQVMLVSPLLAGTPSISSVIEQFVQKQFPSVQSHFWVVNQTELGGNDEIVVDVNTVTQAMNTEDKTENRFLLLIVGGKLEATQEIPLGSQVNCQPEKESV